MLATVFSKGNLTYTCKYQRQADLCKPNPLWMLLSEQRCYLESPQSSVTVQNHIGCCLCEKWNIEKRCSEMSNLLWLSHKAFTCTISCEFLTWTKSAKRSWSLQVDLRHVSKSVRDVNMWKVSNCKKPRQSNLCKLTSPSLLRKLIVEF